MKDSLEPQPTYPFVTRSRSLRAAGILGPEVITVDAYVKPFLIKAHTYVLGLR